MCRPPRRCATWRREDHRLDAGTPTRDIEAVAWRLEANTLSKPWTTLVCVLAALVVARGAPAQEPPDAGAAAERVAIRTATIRGDQVRVLDDPHQFAPGRFLVLLVRTQPGGRIPPALLACGVSGTGLTMRAACVPIPTPNAAGDAETFEVTAFDVADTDQDGEDEATVEVSYVGAWVEPGVGTEFRRLTVLRLIPRPAVVFAVETLQLDMATNRFAVRRVTFTDLDGDSHPDALVALWTCSDPPAADTTQNSATCWHSTAHHRWLAATRRWGPAIPLGR